MSTRRSIRKTPAGDITLGCDPPTYCRVVLMGVIVSRPPKGESLNRAEIVVRVNPQQDPPHADIPIVVYGPAAQTLATYAKRGSTIHVEGELRNAGQLTLGDGALKRAQRGCYVITHQILMLSHPVKGDPLAHEKWHAVITDDVLTLRTDLPF